MGAVGFFMMKTNKCKRGNVNLLYVHMKRVLLFRNGIVVALAAMFTACGAADIEGVWVQPVPGMESMIQGFELNDSGKAASVNMATLRYETWKLENDKLILTGSSIGNHLTIPFTDTLIVEKLTADSLILGEGDMSLRYYRIGRDEAERIANTSVVMPEDKPFMVKGRLVIGHEVRSFVRDGDSAAYWIIDETGVLMQRYDEVTGGIKNGIPVYAELDVVDEGKSDEGFASGYAGVYKVVGVRSLEKIR